MKFFAGIVVVVLVVFAFSSFKPQGNNVKVPKLKTFFACKQSGKIEMSAQQFMQFMNQPICAKDSMKNLFEVVRFDMQYAETGLYQDSAGLPIIHTDYMFASFTGDTINHIWLDMFKEHAYRGDTIRFLNVRAKGSSNYTFKSSNIELILR